MPQIQYSEKYFDDVYEYRWAEVSSCRQKASPHEDPNACLFLGTIEYILRMEKHRFQRSGAAS